MTRSQSQSHCNVAGTLRVSIRTHVAACCRTLPHVAARCRTLPHGLPWCFFGLRSVSATILQPSLSVAATCRLRCCVVPGHAVATPQQATCNVTWAVVATFLQRCCYPSQHRWSDAPVTTLERHMCCRCDRNGRLHFHLAPTQRCNVANIQNDVIAT